MASFKISLYASLSDNKGSDSCTLFFNNLGSKTVANTKLIRITSDDINKTVSLIGNTSLSAK